MKKCFALFIFCVSGANTAFCQPGYDCATATPLCSKDTFSIATLPQGGSGFTPSCFGGTPTDGHWYKFTVGTTGDLAWLCTPTGASIELDWALYNITNGCPTNVNASNYVACNYNYSGSNSSPVGMSPTSSTQCPDSGYTLNAAKEICPSETVIAGQTYAIFINNYSYPTSTGWSLNFDSSTFEMAGQNAFSALPDTICGTQGTITIINNSIEAAGQFWNFGDGTSSISANPGTHSYTQPGTYIISLEDSVASGCTSFSSHSIVIRSSDSITLPTEQTCPGLAATLTAPSFNGGTYLWSAGETTQSITVNPALTTVYTVTCTSVTGCTTTATVNLIVTNNPTAAITGPSQTCNGDSITLTASGGNTYNWANGLGNNVYITVAPSTTTTYSVTATIGANCSATASKTIATNQPVVSQFSQSICSGYAFSFDNRVLTHAGVYYDTLQTIFGCDSIVTLNLIVDSLPRPTVTQSGDTLQTQHFFSYQWLLNDADIGGADSQSYIVTQNGNYIVSVTDTNGCGNYSVAFNVTGVGVPVVAPNYDVKLYPNPNTGSFTLEFADDLFREIEIMDMIGKMIVPPISIGKQKYFNLAELANGIYFLRVSQNSQVKSLKFSVLR